MPKDLSIDIVQHCNVKIRSCAGNGQFLQADDQDDVMVDGLRKDSGKEATFRQFLARSYSEGSQVLAAFERPKKRNYFLCPVKPKRDEVELKLKFKKVKSRKVLDKDDMEIEAKYRRFWFVLKMTDNRFVAYESLAYENYFLFWNGKSVVMLKSRDSDVSEQREFGFDPMASASSSGQAKYTSVKVYERTETMFCYEES